MNDLDAPAAPSSQYSAAYTSEMNPAEIIEAVSNVKAFPVKQRAPADEPVEGLAFTEFERRAVTGLVNGGEARVLEHAKARAAAFTRPDGAQVRIRSLARAVAVAETQMNEFNALLVKVLMNRDFAAAKLVNVCARDATRRFVTLMDELRVESQGGRRAVLVVGAAAQVNVTAAGE
jgi:hypothetical protein